MAVVFVLVGEGVILVGTSMWLRPRFRFLDAPVHIYEVVLLFFGMRMRGEPAFLAVEGCLLYINLLQVLDVAFDSQCSLSHVVPVEIVKGRLLQAFLSTEAICGGVEGVLDASGEVLVTMIADPILSRPRSDLFFLLLTQFESLGLREVAYLRSAPLLERVVLVSFALDLANALLAHLLLVALFKSNYLLHLHLALPEYLLSCLPNLLLHANVIPHTHLVISRARHALLMSPYLSFL